LVPRRLQHPFAAACARHGNGDHASVAGGAAADRADPARPATASFGPLRCPDMAKVFDCIDERLEHWIAAQQMFFVATAPLASDGHVNVSAKVPIETLQVLGPPPVA